MTELLAVYHNAIGLWCYKCRKNSHMQLFVIKMQKYDASLMFPDVNMRTWMCNTCIHKYIPLHLPEKPIFVEERYHYHREIYSGDLESYVAYFTYAYEKHKL